MIEDEKGNLKVVKLPDLPDTPDPHFTPSPEKLITFLGKNGSIDKQVHMNRATRRRLKLYNSKDLRKKK